MTHRQPSVLLVLFGTTATGCLDSVDVEGDQVTKQIEADLRWLATGRRGARDELRGVTRSDSRLPDDGELLKPLTAAVVQLTATFRQVQALPPSRGRPLVNQLAIEAEAWWHYASDLHEAGAAEHPNLLGSRRCGYPLEDDTSCQDSDPVASLWCLCQRTAQYGNRLAKLLDVTRGHWRQGGAVGDGPKLRHPVEAP